MKNHPNLIPKGKNKCSHTLDSSSDDEHLRMTRPNAQIQANTNDFKVEIPKFEGKLDPEEFFDGLHTVVRVFLVQGHSGREESEVGCSKTS